MRKRPRIRVGDIVRFSKKGKLADYPWPDNITMVVVDIIGFDSTDSNCLIRCRAQIHGETVKLDAYRHHLWFTGKNMKDVNAAVRVMNSNEK